MRLRNPTKTVAAMGGLKNEVQRLATPAAANSVAHPIDLTAHALLRRLPLHVALFNIRVGGIAECFLFMPVR